MSSPKVADKAREVRDYWDSFAAVYEEVNKRITIQGSRELHRHLQLSSAENVLEIACGGGIGTLDLVSYLKPTAKVLATDFSPEMIKQAEKRLSHLNNVTVASANALDLHPIATDGSMDRYISSLCLQLVPDADPMLKESFRVLKPGGIAGFSIWGKEENSGIFTIVRQAGLELGLEAAGQLHPNFNLNLTDVHTRVKKAGFKDVVIWPFWTISEVFDFDQYVDFFLPCWKRIQDGLSEEMRHTLDSAVRRIAKEWIESGKPIALEMKLVIARK